ncbi:MAG: HAD-IA family hydrolase [Chloroflexota bacterium]|nr:HAD-IA family hydrolase [Chloroflexota bacterium]
MSKIKAVFFDQDGVIIDTERDGHRVAFNAAFKEFGYDFEWDVETYHGLLQVSGGKERMRHYLHTEGFGAEVKPEDEDELIKAMHKFKTSTFIEMIETGKLPLRPGVKRLMQEVNDAGLILGVCTTSNVRSAHAVAYGVLKDINFEFVLAGDMVSNKKPDPEIYNMAIEKTGFKPEECIVVEDSHNGVVAAKAAGMNIVVTTNIYTAEEDLSAGDIIVSTLGDPDGEKGEFKQRGERLNYESLNYDGVLHLEQLVAYFSN